MIFSRGLTELELCSKLNIPYKSWEQIVRGLRRPSHLLVYLLMHILGDEVQGLFYSYYIDDPLPSIVRGDLYCDNKSAKNMEKYIQKIKNEGKEFRYL